MIEGFKLKITHEELRQHFYGRAGYHTGLANEKEVHLINLRREVEALDKIKGCTSIGSPKSVHHNYDPKEAVENLENDIAAHRKKAANFRFYADHLFDDDYTLNQGDLHNLEIIRI